MEKTLEIVGGTTGTVTVKDVLLKSEGSKSEGALKALLVTISAISGYYAGYGVAQLKPLSCDSADMLRQVSSENLWRSKIEQDVPNSKIR